MDLSDVAIQMLIFWAVGALLGTWIPRPRSICDKLELVKKILNFIGEAPEWINYNQNLEDDIRSLKDMMETLLCVKKDVAQEVEMLELQTNKKRKSEVDNWLICVERKAEEVDNLEREMGQTGAYWRFLFRAWLGSCVQKKKKEVIQLCDQKRDFGPELVINTHYASREKLVTSALVGQFAAVKKEEIWRQLTSQEVTILGVEGDGGMGKTAIMMHIHNRVLDSPHLFDIAFYVNIKEDYEVFQLQDAIGRELKLQDLHDEDDELRRAARIYRALNLHRRFVLILDGLLSDFRLGRVGIPVGGNGGKLVVISRSERVCRIMGCQSITRLDRLPYEDSRELIVETLKPSFGLSPEIEHFADGIIGKCNGVPLRIIKESEILRNSMMSSSHEQD